YQLTAFAGAQQRSQNGARFAFNTRPRTFTVVSQFGFARWNRHIFLRWKTGSEMLDTARSRFVSRVSTPTNRAAHRLNARFTPFEMVPTSFDSATRRPRSVL